MNKTVWKTIIKQKYFCFVEREALNDGILRVVNVENNALIAEKKVNLKFNASPNPEIEDILEWEEFCEKQISKS